MRLLIVDDEEYTREGLAENVDWVKHGIDEIMQAGDGKIALNIAKWFEPDIILTDIRMPKMDGFEFVKRLTTINPDCNIIFMSGYTNVDYLKAAIDLSAVAFVDKPISLEKITEAVSKAVKEFKKKSFHQKLSMENKKLQKQHLANILIHKDKSKDMVLRICNEICFPVDTNYNCVVIWDKDESQKKDKNLNKILSFYKKSGYKCLGNYSEDDNCFLIISFEEHEREDLEQIYIRFSRLYSQYIIGIGFPVSDIMNINSSYTSANKALNYSFYDVKARLFEIDEHLLQRLDIRPNLYSEFLEVYTSTPYELGEWLKKLINQFHDLKYYQKDQVVSLFRSFANTILGDHLDLYKYMDEIKSNRELEIAFGLVNNIHEVKKIIISITNSLIEKLDDTSKYSKVINDVIDYISKNYQEIDFSVQDIADYIELSSTHVNVIFKNEMEVTLKQYLTNIRMDKAKELLQKNSRYNISEIANRCGYSNANYFTKVFKEHHGLTPSEYRNKR